MWGTYCHGVLSFNRTHSSQLIMVGLGIDGTTADAFQVLPVALDTGASTTTIPTKVLIDLGYDLSNPKDVKQIITGSGIISAPIITVRQLTAIGETIENIDVLGHDLPENLSVRGVLGLNFLEHFDFSISFLTRTIELRPPNMV